VVAPARDPRRAPRRTTPAKPPLRLVDHQPSRAARRRRPGARLAAGLLALFLALFTNAVAHSMLVSGQERLDGLNEQVQREQARNERLHLRAASLESPERIVEAAKGLGLVPAGETTWLNPNPTPGTDSSTGATGSGGGDAGTQELAGRPQGDSTEPAGR
jgi:hypothetical protein